MPRERSRSPVNRERRRRSRERDRDRERRRRRDRSRSPDHNESPQRGRERRERDVTPVYDSRTGTPNEPVASGCLKYLKSAEEPIEVQPAEVKEETPDSESNDSSENGLSLDFIQQCPHQIIDTKFLQHLSEMHPVSALHELTHRLGWPGPNITQAFECGPPFAKLYIYKAQVNGQIFQNTVAVNDIKIAKQNVAWLALQEMGFVKPDPSNPL